MARRIARLQRELAARNIVARPHVWLSEEFFTPDRVLGFAVPFYLAHPRLMRLERSQMFECEGELADEFALGHVNAVSLRLGGTLNVVDGVAPRLITPPE